MLMPPDADGVVEAIDIDVVIVEVSMDIVAVEVGIETAMEDMAGSKDGCWGSLVSC